MRDPAITRVLIGTIRSIEELDGYETEAKRRGLDAEEVRLLDERRKQLTRK